MIEMQQKQWRANQIIQQKLELIEQLEQVLHDKNQADSPLKNSPVGASAVVQDQVDKVLLNQEKRDS